MPLSRCCNVFYFPRCLTKREKKGLKRGKRKENFKIIFFIIDETRKDKKDKKKMIKDKNRQNNTENIQKRK